ncbi:MAG: peptidoglycan-binding protein [Sulfobacillus sp.]|nr:peptidoglycan-binding protein [Sulfobacillus sp.]
MNNRRRVLPTAAAGLAVIAVPAMSQVVQAQVLTEPVIQMGDRGPAVSLAEKDLQILGYYHGAIDGIFGPELHQAILTFQGQHGLAQDAIIGPLTWARLSAAVNAPATTNSASPTFQDSAPLLQLGSTGSAVVHLQQLLDTQGYGLATDGNFGPLTYAAVRNFQAAHGLAVDGIAGPATMGLLESLASGNAAVSTPVEAAPPTSLSGYLQEGATGALVAKLQSELTQAGYSTGGVDGIFGPETKAAVIAFQEAHGLPSYGLVGSLTWNALSQVLAGGVQAGVNRGAVSANGTAAVGLAMKYLGYSYRFGGNSPATGFDCSGFTQWVYGQVGISLPRTSYAQWNVGTHVSYDQLQPGDLVFFSTDGIFANHVGIYLGNGEFISAATPSQGVIIQSLSAPYWSQTYDGAVQL